MRVFPALVVAWLLGCGASPAPSVASACDPASLDANSCCGGTRAYTCVDNELKCMCPDGDVATGPDALDALDNGQTCASLDCDDHHACTKDSCANGKCLHLDCSSGACSLPDGCTI